jgi:hypothetical protein
MLQLYDLNFTRVRAISENFCGSNTWSVTGRPLIYNINELAASTGYPTNQFLTKPFASANKYFRALADQHLIHLRTQRNLATDSEDARRRYIARHLFGGGALSRKHNIRLGDIVVSAPRDRKSDVFQYDFSKMI